MTKTYYFIDDSFYSSNGCDCCEPDYMPCFNIDTEEHPDFDLTLGSAHSEEDMMEQVLIQEGVLHNMWYNEDVLDDFFEEPDEYIRNTFREHGFKIVTEREWRGE